MKKDLSVVLDEKTFYLDVEPFIDKDEMFIHLAHWYFEAGLIEDIDIFKHALYEREALGSTYMGNAIAMPHAKSETVKKPSVLFCRMKEPFLYESFGEKGLVRFIFMLAVSQEQTGAEYIRMLASLAGLLANDQFLEKLKSVSSRHQFLTYAADFGE